MRPHVVAAAVVAVGAVGGVAFDSVVPDDASAITDPWGGYSYDGYRSPPNWGSNPPWMTGHALNCNGEYQSGFVRAAQLSMWADGKFGTPSSSNKNQVDSIFGSATWGAVANYQSLYGITDTGGCVQTGTWNKIGDHMNYQGVVSGFSRWQVNDPIYGYTGVAVYDSGWVWWTFANGSWQVMNSYLHDTVAELYWINEGCQCLEYLGNETH